MTQLIETATFEALELKLRGQFENVITPLLLIHEATCPYGADLESLYAPLPQFAGGNDPRKYISIQLEIPEEAAKGITRLEEECAKKSSQSGLWMPILHTHEGRFTIRARIYLDGQRLTAFRLGEGELQTGWANLAPILLQNRNIQGMSLKCAISVQRIWCVEGNRGLILNMDQFVITPQAPIVRIDHFA